MPTDPTDTPKRKAADRSVVEVFLALIGSSISYAESRFQLFGLEGKEAGARLIIGLVWIFAGLVFAVFVYLFLAAFLAAVLTIYAGIPWQWVMLIFAGFHLIMMVVAFLMARRLLSKGCFQESLRQFQLDREWIDQWKKSITPADPA